MQLFVEGHLSQNLQSSLTRPQTLQLHSQMKLYKVKLICQLVLNEKSTYCKKNYNNKHPWVGIAHQNKCRDTNQSGFCKTQAYQGNEKNGELNHCQTPFLKTRQLRAKRN